MLAFIASIAYTIGRYSRMLTRQLQESHDFIVWRARACWVFITIFTRVFVQLLANTH